MVEVDFKALLLVSFQQSSGRFLYSYESFGGTEIMRL